MTKDTIKVLTITMLVAGAVSCGKEPASEQEESIVSRDEIVIVDGMATKTISEGTLLPTDYTLFMSAHLTDDVSTKNTCNYFVCRPFKYKTDSWHAVPAAYWPFSGDIDFLGLATGEKGPDIASLAGWDSDDCSRAVRMDVPDGKAVTDEILFGEASSRRTGHDPAAIVLHHSQAKLKFNMICNATGLLRIDDIIIRNVYTGGVFSVTNDGFLDASWRYGGHVQVEEYTVPNSQNLEFSTEKISLVSFYPEQPGREIEIRYRRRDFTTDSWEDASKVDSVVIKAKEDKWWMGNCYSYTLQVSLDGISYTVDVAPWNSEDKNF